MTKAIPADSANNVFEIRGLMLDSARLTERHEFYFSLLERLARWGFNTIWWHFTDDEGCSLKFKSHPELASPYAFSRTQMRRFIQAAGDVGIDVVPEVETLGHCEYITHLPQYNHLRNGTSSWKNACCPSHSDTLVLMRELIEETAELYPSPYLHVGLDEVDISGCRLCQRRGRDKPSWWIYAKHVEQIHRIVTDCGKRMIMWADHIAESPDMLDVLPRDILMAHWQYDEVNTSAIDRSIEAGFEVICCPTVCKVGAVIMPPSETLDVTEQLVTEAAHRTGDGMRGVVTTWWTPYRILRDAALPSIAYSANIILKGKAVDSLAAMRRYASQEFGLSDKDVSQAIWGLHRLVPRLCDLAALMFNSTADWVEAIPLARADGFDERAENVSKYAAVLRNAQHKVKRNPEEYDALVMAAELSDICLQNGQRLLAAYNAYRTAERYWNRNMATQRVAAELDKALVELNAMSTNVDKACCMTSAEWNRTRHPRDPKKGVFGSPETTPCHEDNILSRFVHCRPLLQKFIRRLTKATASYRNGNAFPDWF